MSMCNYCNVECKKKNKKMFNNQHDDIALFVFFMAG